LSLSNRFILKSFKFTSKENISKDYNDKKVLFGKNQYDFEIGFLDKTFEDISSNQDFPISILIGPNGVGKSYILRKITDAFRILEYYIEYKEIRNSYKNIFKKFHLEYYCNGKHNIIKFENNKFLDLPSKNNLPNVILASSVLINDKFLFQDNDNAYIDDTVKIKKKTMYKYSGIKYTSNQAGTKTFIKKTLDSILRVSNDDKSINLNKIFEILNFDKKLIIQFQLKNIKKFFDSENEVTYEDLDDHFLNWESRTKNRKTVPYSYTKYLNLKNENENFVFELSNFINTIKLKKSDSNQIIYHIDTENLKMVSLKKEYSYIEHLISLDLITSPIIKVLKNNKTYGLEEISSGEYSYLFSMVNLISYIEENSLIVVDEPEISLHPNWQIEYMNNLENIFNNYNSSHFIFATHSHFMIPNIKSSLSSIIKISEKGIINNKNSYYGWSPENVLYNIFNMTTTRNHYFEMDIRELINLISKNNPKNISKIQDLIDKLEIFEINESDPLNELINEAKDFIKKFSND
jgi:predicted ATPase